MFINDYSEFKVKEEYHKNVKNLIYNRKDYNFDLALASIDKTSFCNGMKSRCDMYLTINHWRSEFNSKWNDLFD